MKPVDSKLAIAVSATLAGLLAGCGGGSDDLHAFVQPIKGGIWHGTDSISGQPLYGIVAENGTFAFVRDDMNAVYTGKGEFDKQLVTATFEAFTAPGFTFDDGSNHGTGMFQGWVSSRDTMKLDVEFLTDAGTPPADIQAGSIPFRFDSAYETASSLPRISGLYSLGSDTLSISTTGEVFAQLTGNGCVLNGKVTVQNAKFNVYGMSLAYSSCTGGSAGLNGLTLSGVVTIDMSKIPERIVGGLSATSAGIAIAMPRL